MWLSLPIKSRAAPSDVQVTMNYEQVASSPWVPTFCCTLLSSRLVQQGEEIKSHIHSSHVCAHTSYVSRSKRRVSIVDSFNVLCRWNLNTFARRACCTNERKYDWTMTIAIIVWRGDALPSSFARFLTANQFKRRVSSNHLHFCRAAIRCFR